MASHHGLAMPLQLCKLCSSPVSWSVSWLGKGKKEKDQVFSAASHPCWVQLAGKGRGGMKWWGMGIVQPECCSHSEWWGCECGWFNVYPLCSWDCSGPYEVGDQLSAVTGCNFWRGSRQKLLPCAIPEESPWHHLLDWALPGLGGFLWDGNRKKYVREPLVEWLPRRGNKAWGG